jgi:hypothetical protein
VEITVANFPVAQPMIVNFNNASLVTLSTVNGPITFGNNGAAPTTLQAGSSSVFNVNAGGATGTITFAKAAVLEANALFFTNFLSTNFTADIAITNTPLALQTITFTNVPTIDFTANGIGNAILIGNNNTVNAVNIRFPDTLTFNMTTTSAAGDIFFGNTTGVVANTGATALIGGSSSVLTAQAGQNIKFQLGATTAAVSYTFDTFNKIDF